MTTVIDVDAAARALEGEAPERVLVWAAANLPKLTFATGFGAEGCVIIDMIARANLPIDLFTLDTGVLFPETYALWRKLEQRYGVTIRAVRAERPEPERWRVDADGCCEQRKIRPLREALASFDAWITAIRRDQTPERAHAGVVEHDRKFGLVKVNPLVAWSHDDVWAYIYQHDIPYNPLHDRGYPSIGCAPCTSAIVPGENLRAGRWRGAAKKECGLHTSVPLQAKEKP